MNQTEKRLFLIRSLLNEQPRYQGMEIPCIEAEQKRILRSLLNIRMPGEISDEFLNVQDEYLREETRQKTDKFSKKENKSPCFWLKNTLRNAGNKFTVVMMHHPVYSSAQGRSNPLMWLAFHSAMREADMVFSGHDHNYARRTEHYKARFWKKEEPTIFIGTNASIKKYPVKENKKYEVSLVGEPVYEHIFVTPNTLHISTYTIHSGERIDNVEIIR